MITDPTRICERLVGLPEVAVEGVGTFQLTGPMEIFIETKGDRPGCSACGTRAVVKDRSRVSLVDLRCFGRAARLVWSKRRWACPDGDCGAGSWTERNNAIAAPRFPICHSGGCRVDTG